MIRRAASSSYQPNRSRTSEPGVNMDDLLVEARPPSGPAAILVYAALPLPLPRPRAPPRLELEGGISFPSVLDHYIDRRTGFVSVSSLTARRIGCLGLNFIFVTSAAARGIGVEPELMDVPDRLAAIAGADAGWGCSFIDVRAVEDEVCGGAGVAAVEVDAAGVGSGTVKVVEVEERLMIRLTS